MIIDPKSNVPIFRQIADQMREAITAGVHEAGEALPSLRALAVEVRVNPNTVQRAYDELEREGVVESRRGLGVFVVDSKKFAARDRAERKVARSLGTTIAGGLDGGVTPVRMRELFESCLRSELQVASRRK